jgi:hypothetical protein
LTTNILSISDRNTAIATLMQALEACSESGEVITVQSPFEDGPTRLVDVPVIAIDVAAQKFKLSGLVMTSENGSPFATYKE